MWLQCKNKEGNDLFNDILNTFCLWLYFVVHMVKIHLDSEGGNPPHFSISCKGYFIHIIQQTRHQLPQPFLHQLCCTGWNKKYLNGSTMVDRYNDQECTQHSVKHVYIALETFIWETNHLVSQSNVSNSVWIRYLSSIPFHWLRSNEWMNEWMFNDTPARKTDRLLGVRKR